MAAVAWRAWSMAWRNSIRIFTLTMPVFTERCRSSSSSSVFFSREVISPSGVLSAIFVRTSFYVEALLDSAGVECFTQIYTDFTDRATRRLIKGNKKGDKQRVPFRVLSCFQQLLVVIIGAGDALAGDWTEEQFVIVSAEIKQVEESAGLFVQRIAADSLPAQPVVFDEAGHGRKIRDRVVDKV